MRLNYWESTEQERELGILQRCAEALHPPVMEGVEAYRWSRCPTAARGAGTVFRIGFRRLSRQASRSYRQEMATDLGGDKLGPLTGSEPRGDYLDRLMRRKSFMALWPLFAKATKPAKELTESFSALVHLRPLIAKLGSCRVIHVGDGAHARTGALFALKSATENISVDPVINIPLVSSWQEKFQVERLSWRKARLSEVASELNALPPVPVLVTFVHAHIDTDETLSLLRWDAAFTLTCCVQGKQLSRAYVPSSDSEDFCVLSEGRRFQVLVNPKSSLLSDRLEE